MLLLSYRPVSQSQSKVVYPLTSEGKKLMKEAKPRLLNLEAKTAVASLVSPESFLPQSDQVTTTTYPRGRRLHEGKGTWEVLRMSPTHCVHHWNTGPSFPDRRSHWVERGYRLCGRGALRRGRTGLRARRLWLSLSISQKPNPMPVFSFCKYLVCLPYRLFWRWTWKCFINSFTNRWYYDPIHASSPVGFFCIPGSLFLFLTFFCSNIWTHYVLDTMLDTRRGSHTG